MPTYSVTMFLPKPERPGWTKMQMLVKARSIDDADHIATRRFDKAVLSVRTVKPDAEREKWKRIWARAYNNMPVFLRSESRENWRKLDKPLPVGEYIKLEAKGLIRHGMRRSTAQQRYLNHPFKKTWRTQRIKMLSRCLNYPRDTRGGQFVSARDGLMRGTVPKSTAKQEVLKHLAGPKGQLIALKLLNGEHLYDPEPTRANPNGTW